MHKLIIALAISSTFVLPSSFAASFNSIISDFDRLISVDQSSRNPVDQFSRNPVDLSSRNPVDLSSRNPVNSNYHIASYTDNAQRASMVKCTEIQKSNYSQYEDYVFLNDGYSAESYMNCIGIPSSELFYTILNTDYTKVEDVKPLPKDINPVSAVEKKAPHKQKAVNTTQKNLPKNKEIKPFVSSPKVAATQPVTVRKLSQQAYINKRLPYYNRQMIVMMNCYAQYLYSNDSRKIIAYIKCKQ